MKILLSEEQYGKLIDEINVKYTEDQLRDIANKYNFMGEFKKNNPKAYESIRKNYRNLWDEIQSKMDKKYNPLSDDELLKLAKKHGDDFINKEPKLYADALRRRIIQPNRKKWTAQEIQNIADNYTDLNDFIKHENKAYQAALTMGIKDEIISHMRIRSRNLSFEDLVKMAEPFKYKIDFLRSDPSAYKTANAKGILDQLKKWEPLGNKVKRMVYAYEFRDKKGNPLAIYVGLTSDEERRDKQHMNILVSNNKKQSPVYRYIVENKIKPIKKILSNGYIPYMEAIDMECYYQNDFYKKDKNKDGSLVWKPLHSSKCGGLGGSERWTEDKIRKESEKFATLKDFKKYASPAVRAAKRKGIYDDVIKNLQENSFSFENIISEKLRDMAPSLIYHHTTEERALGIMNSNMLTGSKPFPELMDLDPTLKHSKHKMMVSFTRDKNFIPDASIGNSGDGPRVNPTMLNVIFVADRNRLKSRYRVVPFDFSIIADKAWAEVTPRSRKNPEVEERVLTDRIYPLRQYLTNIIYTGNNPEVQKKIDEYLSGIK